MEETFRPIPSLLLQELWVKTLDAKAAASTATTRTTTTSSEVIAFSPAYVSRYSPSGFDEPEYPYLPSTVVSLLKLDAAGVKAGLDSAPGTSALWEKRHGDLPDFFKHLRPPSVITLTVLSTVTAFAMKIVECADFKNLERTIARLELLFPG